MTTALLEPTLHSTRLPPIIMPPLVRERSGSLTDPCVRLRWALETDYLVRTDGIMLEALFGPLPQDAPGETPCLNEERTSILWALPEGGMLYLLPNGDLLAVHQKEPLAGVLARLFSNQQDLEQLWASIDAVYAGLVPGEGRPRFALMREVPPLRGCEPTFAVLDLLTGDVLKRASGEADLREICHWANQNTEDALAAIALERASTLCARQTAPVVRPAGPVRTAERFAG